SKARASTASATNRSEKPGRSVCIHPCEGDGFRASRYRGRKFRFSAFARWNALSRACWSKSKPVTEDAPDFRQIALNSPVLHPRSITVFELDRLTNSDTKSFFRMASELS